MSTTSLNQQGSLGSGEVAGRYQAATAQQHAIYGQLPSAYEYSGYSGPRPKPAPVEDDPLTQCKVCKGFYPKHYGKCPDASSH